MFVRDFFIAVALEKRKWNIVTYESHRVLELLVKGMIRLLGYSPAEIHDLHTLFNNFLELAKEKDNYLPFVVTVCSEENDQLFGIMISEGQLYVIERGPDGAGTVRASDLPPAPHDQEVNCNIEVTEDAIKISIDDQEIFDMTGYGIKGPFRKIKRSVRILSAPTRLKEIRKIGSWMDKKSRREEPFYSDRIVSEEEAMSAVSRMKEAIGILENIILVD